MDLDTQVKLSIYRAIANTTIVPTVSQVAQDLGRTPTEVAAAFRRLADNRLLVLEPGEPDRIRMAPPFSGVPTRFRVVVGGRSYYANCVWDAYGVSAALKEDGEVHTTCGHSGVPINLSVRGGRPVEAAYPVHFAVPTATWWDDIIYT